MSAAFEVDCQQINERTPLVSEVEWLSDDHLRQGESAQSGPKQVADCLAPSSPTERIESAPETGQLVREIGQVLFEPRFAAGRVATRISNAASEAGLLNAFQPASTMACTRSRVEPDRQFDVVDRVTQEVVAVIDHGHEHGVAIAKVILDHTPGHSGPLGDMARGYRREAFFANTSDRLVDDELPGPVASGLALHGSSGGSGPTGRRTPRVVIA